MMRKRLIHPGALILCLLLLPGCAAAQTGTSSNSEAQEETGETVYGIITHVNGNEIQMELLSLNGGAQRSTGAASQEDAAETPSDPEASPGDFRPSAEGRPSGAGQRAGEGSGRKPTGGGEENFPSGQNLSGGAAGMPDGMTMGGSSAASSTKSAYTRTGEETTLLIPVGTAVLTGTGENAKTRTFNSLQVDYVISVTTRTRADGSSYLAAVQILQTSS